MPASADLHVHALVDSLTSGGAELLLSEFAAVAPASGIRFSVGYLQERGGDPGAVRLRAQGVEPILVGVPGNLYDPVALSRVSAHLREVAPQLVHTHLGNADLLGGLAARRMRVPAVSTLHGMTQTAGVHGDTHYGVLRDRVLPALTARVRRRCDQRVIAVSEQARQSYLDRYPETPDRVVTVHNGVTARPQPGAGAGIRAELGLPADALVVGMVSALRPEKAHEVAIEAVRSLADRMPDLRLVIVGDGPSRDSVEALAAGNDRVMLTGHRDDVMATLDALDLLAHPSRHEAFPTTLLEAMVAGVPVVATRIGGIPEIVDEGETGLLIASPPSVAELAACINRLLADEAERVRLAQQAREAVAERFGGERWARATRAVYDAALAIER